MKKEAGCRWTAVCGCPCRISAGGVEEELAVDPGRQDGREVVLEPDRRPRRPDVVEAQARAAVEGRDPARLGRDDREKGAGDPLDQPAHERGVFHHERQHHLLLSEQRPEHVGRAAHDRHADRVAAAAGLHEGVGELEVFPEPRVLRVEAHLRERVGRRFQPRARREALAPGADGAAQDGLHPRDPGEGLARPEAVLADRLGLGEHALVVREKGGRRRASPARSAGRARAGGGPLESGARRRNRPPGRTPAAGAGARAPRSAGAAPGAPPGGRAAWRRAVRRRPLGLGPQPIDGAHHVLLHEPFGLLRVAGADGLDQQAMVVQPIQHSEG